MRRKRRTARAAWLTAVAIALLAVPLGALLMRQVERECASYLEGERSRLEERVRLALANLEVLEKAALDELGRVAEGRLDAGAVRRTEDDHAVVRLAFIVIGEALAWPPPLDRDGPLGPEVWRDTADDPAARRFFGRVDERLARGDRAGALAAIELGPERTLSRAAQAEAELRRATLLEGDPTQAAAAVACLDRVVELAAAPEGGVGLAPWAAAARLRKGRFLLERGDAAGGAIELLGLLSDLVGPADERRDDFAGYCADGAAAELRRLETSGGLEPASLDAWRALESHLVRRQAEAAFRAELDRELLARIRTQETPAAELQRLAGRGADAVVFRRLAGTPGRLVGFRANPETIAARLLEALGVEVGLRDGQELLLAGVEIQGEKIEARLGGGLPWRIEAPIGAALEAFRSRRVALYTGGLAVGLLLGGAAAFATLRGMARELEVAELKGEFVANVSHELKTPLTLIRMFSDMLRFGYTKDPAEAEKSLAVISREAESLGFLIDNVLEAARIEAGEKQYRPEPTDLTALVRRLVDEFRPYAENKGFTVRLEAAADVPPAAVDHAGFAQALRNLLGNAVKYSPERKEIEVSVREAAGSVAVAVADRGIGLGAADRRRLFERFYRAPDSGQAVAGTGIGLSIVRHVALGHGGSVEARDRDGGGSVFELRFPAGDRSDARTDPDR